MRKKGIAAVLVMTTALAVTATPAEASVSQGAVAASTIFLSDDWDDEGEVSRSRHPNSGATGLWQAVLWADGAIERDGTRFDESDIDCEFGPNTEAATRSWQRARGGLADDGRAGPRTWGRAGDSLRLKAQIENAWVVEYVGRYNGRRFQVVRNDVGRGYYYDGWYWALSWGPDFIQYHRKADGCGSGAPRY